jgi:hypothetical protein
MLLQISMWYRTIFVKVLTAWRLIQQWYDMPMGDGCFCKKCGLGEEWIIDIAVSGTLAKCCDVQYGNTRFWNISDQRHWPESPLMSQIALCFLYCSSGLWAFCQAVILLTYVVATKIWSYGKLNPWHIIHILGFITANFLPVSWLWQL